PIPSSCGNTGRGEPTTRTPAPLSATTSWPPSGASTGRCTSTRPFHLNTARPPGTTVAAGTAPVESPSPACTRRAGPSPAARSCPSGRGAATCWFESWSGGRTDRPLGSSISRPARSPGWLRSARASSGCTRCGYNREAHVGGPASAPDRASHGRRSLDGLADAPDRGQIHVGFLDWTLADGHDPKGRVAVPGLLDEVRERSPRHQHVSLALVELIEGLLGGGGPGRELPLLRHGRLLQRLQRRPARGHAEDLQ